MNLLIWEQIYITKNCKKLKQFPTRTIMDIFLQVEQILGMAWKKKKLKKREDVYKSITLHFPQIGK